MENMATANDTLQRATREGNWIYWRSGDDGETAYLASMHASVVLGSLGEGVEALLERIPRAEAELDAV